MGDESLPKSRGPSQMPLDTPPHYLQIMALAWPN